MFSITFSGKSHSGLQHTMPALLIKMSTPPNSSFRFLAASKTFSRFDMSTTYPLHEMPSAWSSSIVLFMAVIKRTNGKISNYWIYVCHRSKMSVKRSNNSSEERERKKRFSVKAANTHRSKGKKYNCMQIYAKRVLFLFVVLSFIWKRLRALLSYCFWSISRKTNGA